LLSGWTSVSSSLNPTWLPMSHPHIDVGQSKGKKSNRRRTRGRGGITKAYNMDVRKDQDMTEDMKRRTN
jgi:hypothetical protein